MEIEIFKLLIGILGAVYFMLPAYVANLSGLAFGGGTPVDGGKECKDGRRLIGNGVTWKGFINGTILGTIVGGILGIIGSFYGDLNVLTSGVIALPVYGSIIGGLTLGFLMAFGALLGDLVGSFIKRRMGLQSGEPAPAAEHPEFPCCLAHVLHFLVFLQIFKNMRKIPFTKNTLISEQTILLYNL